MRHCPHCGAVAESSVSEKGGQLRCPRCEIRLEQQSVGKTTLDTCTKCGGLWLNKIVFQTICTQEKEQEAVLAFRQNPMDQKPVSRKPQRAYIPCPECKKLMNPKNFSGSGIVLDWCRDHGSWLDRNELQKIVKFIKEGGLKKAREREEQHLKDQRDSLKIQELRMMALERRLEPDTLTADGWKQDSILDFLFK